MNALSYSFLWQQLSKSGSGSGDAGPVESRRKARGSASGSRL